MSTNVHRPVNSARVNEPANYYMPNLEDESPRMRVRIIYPNGAEGITMEENNLAVERLFTAFSAMSLDSAPC
jgi:hypothetical protein